MRSGSRPAAQPARSSEFPRITNTGIELFVDSNVNDKIREMRVSTSVFLRNQNEAPVAIPQDPVNIVGPRTVLFNGSRSTDTESRTLQYYWFKGTAPTAANFTDCNAVPTGMLDQGVNLTYPFPAADRRGRRRTFGSGQGPRVPDRHLDPIPWWFPLMITHGLRRTRVAMVVAIVLMSLMWSRMSRSAGRLGLQSHTRAACARVRSAAGRGSALRTEPRDVDQVAERGHPYPASCTSAGRPPLAVRTPPRWRALPRRELRHVDQLKGST